MAMSDENLLMAVGELVLAYMAGAHGQDKVYMDTETGRYFFTKWEDCVLDDTFYHIFSCGWRLDEMPDEVLAGIVDVSTVKVPDGEFEGCWYCDTDRLVGLLEEYDEEQKVVMGDE